MSDYNYLSTLEKFQRSTLAGSYMESILFGFYTCLVTLTLWRVAIYQPRGPFLPTYLCMFIYVTCLGKFVLDIMAGFRVWNMTSIILDRTDWIMRTFHDLFTMLSITSGEFLLAWRVYVLMGRRPILKLIPIAVVVLGSMAILTLLTLNIILTTHPNDIRTSNTYNTIIIPLAALDVLIDFCLTSSIIWKLHQSNRRVKTLLNGNGNSAYKRVAFVLIESGFTIWTVMVIYLIAIPLQDLTLINVTRSNAVVITGIAATAIVLQSTFKVSSRDDSSDINLEDSIRFDAKDSLPKLDWAQQAGGRPVEVELEVHSANVDEEAQMDYGVADSRAGAIFSNKAARSSKVLTNAWLVGDEES